MILPISLVALLLSPSPISLASVAVMPETSVQRKGNKGSDYGAQQVLNAYRNQQSDVMIEGLVGVIEVVLSDDLEGSRHQRFIVRLASGQTVLIVHNIDLAPRIDSLRVGDHVTVKGEYEWNDRGGLIHWTHHDPRGRHEGGWIEHNGFLYE